MNKTNIEWCDFTWGTVSGCDKVSPGCRACYAGHLVETRLSKTGLPQYKDGFYGNVQIHPRKLSEPLRMKKPKRIFVNSMSDLFHEKVPFEFIAAVYGVMAACPQHTFMILTKRPERALEFFEWLKTAPLEEDEVSFCMSRFEKEMQKLTGDSNTRPLAGKPIPSWPPKNVWLGVSVEDQKRADERIPLLLQCPAAIRWISAEPLLGPIKFWSYDDQIRDGQISYNWLTGKRAHLSDVGESVGVNVTYPFGFGPKLDWIVTGGESGPDARPANPNWFRSVRDQCAAAGIPYLHKRNGEWGDPPPDALIPLKEFSNVPDGVGCVQSGKWAFMGTPSHKRPLLKTPLTYIQHYSDWDFLYCVGKKKAGRLLDGVLHDEYPNQVGVNI